MEQKKPFISTTIWVLLGRAGGVLIPFLIALLWGAGPATDAFFFAYAIIFSLQNIFAHIFEASLVPFIVERKDAPEKSMSFTLGALKASFPLMSLFSIGLAFALPFILRLSPSVHPETSLLVSRLYWEMLPGLLMAALVSAYQGFFYAHKNFWFPAVSPLFRTMMMALFFIFLRGPLGVHSLTLGFLAGETARWACAHWLLAREERIRFSVPPEDFRKVLEFFRQASFQFLALLAMNILPLTDQWAAAPLGPGGLSLFNYADRLLQVPYLLFFYGFTQIFLSFWAESFQKEESGVFYQKVGKDMRVVFAGAAALVFFLWIAASPLVKLIFMRSNLTEPQLLELTGIFRWLAAGFLPGILRILYGRVLIIIKKSRFYFLQCWVELFLKVGFNFIFADWFGIRGLAMATAAVYAVTAVWLYLYLKIQARGNSRAVKGS